VEGEVVHNLAAQWERRTQVGKIKRTCPDFFIFSLARGGVGRQKRREEKKKRGKRRGKRIGHLFTSYSR